MRSFSLNGNYHSIKKLEFTHCVIWSWRNFSRWTVGCLSEPLAGGLPGLLAGAIGRLRSIDKSTRVTYSLGARRWYDGTLGVFKMSGERIMASLMKRRRRGWDWAIIRTGRKDDAGCKQHRSSGDITKEKFHSRENILPISNRLIGVSIVYPKQNKLQIPHSLLLRPSLFLCT